MKQTFSDICYALSCAGIGGLMAIISTPKNKRVRRFSGIMCQLSIAVFMGFLVHNICMEMSWITPGQGFHITIVALSGYCSRYISDTLKNAVRCKLNYILNKLPGGPITPLDPIQETKHDKKK